MPLLSVECSLIQISLVNEVGVVISPTANFKPILVGSNAFQITKVLTVPTVVTIKVSDIFCKHSPFPLGLKTRCTAAFIQVTLLTSLVFKVSFVFGCAMKCVLTMFGN